MTTSTTTTTGPSAAPTAALAATPIATTPTAATPAPAPASAPALLPGSVFYLPPVHYADPPASLARDLLAAADAADEEEARGLPWWAHEVAPIALLGDNLGAELLGEAAWPGRGEVDVGLGARARVGGETGGKVERSYERLLATKAGAARGQRARKEHLPRGWQRGPDWPQAGDEEEDDDEEEESRDGVEEGVASGEGGDDSWDVLGWEEGRVPREKVGALDPWQMLGLVPCREFYLD